MYESTVEYARRRLGPVGTTSAVESAGLAAFERLNFFAALAITAFFFLSSGTAVGVDGDFFLSAGSGTTGGVELVVVLPGVGLGFGGGAGIVDVGIALVGTGAVGGAVWVVTAGVLSVLEVFGLTPISMNTLIAIKIQMARQDAVIKMRFLLSAPPRLLLKRKADAPPDRTPPSVSSL